MRKIREPLGSSLVEILMVAGIMSFVALALGSVIFSQARETKSLRQKLEIMDLEKHMQAALVTSDVCTAAVLAGNYYVDPTNLSAASVDLTDIKLTTDAAAPALVSPNMKVGDSGLVIDKVQFAGFTAAGPNKYRAFLFVKFKPDDQIRVLKSIRLTRF